MQFTFSNFGLKIDKLEKKVIKLVNYVYINTNSDFSLIFVMILIVFFVVIVATKYFHCRVVATKFYKTKIPSLFVNSLGGEE